MAIFQLRMGKGFPILRLYTQKPQSYQGTTCSNRLRQVKANAVILNGKFHSAVYLSEAQRDTTRPAVFPTLLSVSCKIL